MIILALFIVFFLGIPIGFSLGLVSLGQIVMDGYPLLVVVQRMFTGADSIALTAIPLFILSGNLMYKGGMSKALVDFADTLVGHFPAPGHGTVLASMLFAAITGSAIAAAAAIGGIMILSW